MDNRKISVAITSWQRYSETLESFAQVAEDSRVSEIIIVDDCSDLEIFKKLESAVSVYPKVKLFRNLFNRDCYVNKMTAVSYCNNPFCVIWDSDNKLTNDYLDKIFAIKEWDSDTVYQPSWAMPLFDFRVYSGLTITKENVADYLDRPLFSTLLNAMNYFVNRDKYIEVWERDINPHTADSILQNYNHLKSGGSIYVVPEMFYEHRVHDGSHYKKNVHKTGNLYQVIESNLRQLK